ncbi:hypothetical protein K9B33_16335 [Sphingobium sp. 3R8]|uniref:hypothetical protein n=1 Tax=Sphingobium sp. 3R8 TaxID=2874921 RepID=UPI001CCFB977|nr:hypothetical protein [Sphingobium sp. 3R8]MBZ9649108.1 hypothetical protein [Sphingobium sp. 3R8]
MSVQLGTQAVTNLSAAMMAEDRELDFGVAPGLAGEGQWQAPPRFGCRPKAERRLAAVADMIGVLCPGLHSKPALAVADGVRWLDGDAMRLFEPKKGRSVNDKWNEVRAIYGMFYCASWT